MNKKQKKDYNMPGWLLAYEERQNAFREEQLEEEKSANDLTPCEIDLFLLGSK